MKLTSWTRFRSRDLTVDAGVMGGSHSFHHGTARISVLLPSAADADRDSRFDQVASRGVRQVEKDGSETVLQYHVHAIDVRVDMGTARELPEQILERPVKAIDLVSEDVRADLDGLADAHESLAAEAFDYWLEVLRWSANDPDIGRFALKDNRSGWTTYLHENSLDRKVWAGCTVFRVPADKPVTLEHWSLAGERLAQNAAVPLHRSLLLEALHVGLRRGDYRRAIVDMAIACETFLRSVVVQAMPPTTQPELKQYVELANINQYIAQFFPGLLDPSVQAEYKELRKHLNSLVSKRNDAVHRGDGSGATREACERFGAVLNRLFDLPLVKTSVADTRPLDAE